MTQEKSKFETITTSRAFRTFLPFLLLSYSIWALSNLAEKQIDTVPIRIKYSNFPKDKYLVSNIKETFNVEIETSGFNILKAKLFKKELIIDPSKAQFVTDTTSYISTEQFLTALQNNYTNIKVLRINPDTLFFNYKQLFSKKLPIKLHTAISYKKGFNTVSDITIKPKELSVFGTKEQLKNSDTIHTVILNKTNLSEDINQKLALVKHKGIRYSLDSIVVNAKVDQMLVGELKVPYTIKNKEKQEIITFPKQVTIQYKTPVKVANSIKSSDFNVICNFKENKDKQLIPKLIKSPKNIKIIRISPKAIQYLIKE